MRISLPQFSFAGGALGSKYYSRPDIGDVYRKSLRECVNMIPHPDGAALRRPGSVYVGAAQDLTGNIKFLPFEHSKNNHYIIEATNGVFRFLLNRDFVRSSGTPISITSTGYDSSAVVALNATVVDQKLYIVCPTVAPKVLTRNSATSFSLAAVNFVDGPYFDLAHPSYGGIGSGITITPSGMSGTVTLTASSSLFVSTDVGRLIRYRSDSDSEWGYATIAGYTSGTSVTASVGKAFDAASASTQWHLGCWSDTTGYPELITSFRGHLVFARTIAQPNGLWISRGPAEITNFSPDDDYNDLVTQNTAVSVELVDLSSISTVVNRHDEELFIGSTSGQYAIRDLTKGLLEAQVVEINRAPSSSEANALNIENSTFIIADDKKRLFEVPFLALQQPEENREIDLNLRNETYGLDLFKEIVAQKMPFGILWIRMNDGSLRSLTVDNRTGARAWAKHSIGGTDASVKALAVSHADACDTVYVAVSRTIDGQTKQFIEYIGDFLDDDAAAASIRFCDSNIYVSGSATTSFTVSHLPNSTVVGNFNGGDYSGISTDGNGALTAPIASTTAAIGLPYDSYITLLRQEGGNPIGTSMGRPDRIFGARFNVWQSNALSVNVLQTSDINEIGFNAQLVYNEGPVLYSGWKQSTVGFGTGREEVILKISAVGTYALNLVGITLEVDRSDF